MGISSPSNTGTIYWNNKNEIYSIVHETFLKLTQYTADTSRCHLGVWLNKVRGTFGAIWCGRLVPSGSGWVGQFLKYFFVGTKLFINPVWQNLGQSCVFAGSALCQMTYLRVLHFGLKAQMLHLEIIDCSRQSNVSHLWLSFGRIYQFVMLPPPRKTDTSFL